MTAEDITGPGTPGPKAVNPKVWFADAKDDSGQWFPGLGFGKQTKPVVPEIADSMGWS